MSADGVAVVVNGPTVHEPLPSNPIQPFVLQPTKGEQAVKSNDPVVIEDEREDVSAFATAFVQMMPTPDAVVMQSADFWNELGVWQSRITEEMDDHQWMVTKLSRLGYTFLDGLARWLNLFVEQPTVARLANAISKEAAQQRRSDWPMVLFLIDALVHNRSHQAIGEMGKLTLGHQTLGAILDSELTPRSLRLAVALQIYITNPSDLSLMMLYERAERFSYNRYIRWGELSPLALLDESAGHRNSAGEVQVGDQVQPTYGAVGNALVGNALVGNALVGNALVGNAVVGNAVVGNAVVGNAVVDKAVVDKAVVDKAVVDKAVVNKALEKVEAGPQGGRHSRCLRVLNRSDGSILVFIRRVLRQRSIAEMERTIFGDEAETIVLKFHENMEVIEERSTKGIGAVIAKAIAEQIFGGEISYVRDRSQTPFPDVKRLLSSLRHGDDPSLLLVEVHLNSAPLPGSPALMLRGSKEQPLAEALGVLEKSGLNLVEYLEDIRHVGVAYQATHQGSTPSYRFKLRFEVCGTGKMIIRYMAAQASSNLCRGFEEHMRVNHEITVIPAAR